MQLALEQQVQAPAPAPAATVAAPGEEPAPAVRLPGEKEPRPRPVIARPTDAPVHKAHASPAVRRFARELGVDLVAVKGSGPKGRVLKEDVQAFVKRALAEGGAAPAAGWRGRPTTPPGAAPPPGSARCRHHLAHAVPVADLVVVRGHRQGAQSPLAGGDQGLGGSNSSCRVQAGTARGARDPEP